ncbi:MAG: porin family protein [Cyclobacteriaceae bacterium]
MRVFLKSVVGALIVLLSVQAQAQDEARYGYGIKAGISVSSFSSNVPHAGPKIGYTLGGFGTYVITPVFTLLTEINYLQQGGSLLTYLDETRFGAPSNFFTVNQTHSNVTLHTLEMPVMLQYTLPFEDLPIKVSAGPSFSYVVDATDNFQRTGYTATNVIVTTSGTDNVKSTYESFQIGATGNLGFFIPFGGKTINIDARYMYGITPIRKNYSYITLNNNSEELRANSIVFTVGLTF